ncbi:MAG: Fic family protein [Alphaproteobacteria bacterium]|nr:Fic family protein [Alphaproteobacteria bacterium]
MAQMSPNAVFLLNQLDGYNRIYQTKLKSCLTPGDFYGWVREEMSHLSNALERTSATRVSDEAEIRRVFELEQAGHNQAFDAMRMHVAPGAKLDGLLIRRLHKALLQETMPDAAGKYRQCQAWALGSQSRYARYEKVPSEMCDLIEAHQTSGKHPIVKSLDLHNDFVRIHPFEDGNGRVGRLLMNWSLMSDGYFPLIIAPQARRSYITALENYSVSDGQSDDIHLFLMQQMSQSFLDLSDRLDTYPRRLTTRVRRFAGVSGRERSAS